MLTRILETIIGTIIDIIRAILDGLNKKNFLKELL